MAAERLSGKLKVFISYSRQNLAFVDRLQAALAERDIDAAVDRSEIAKGEEWWKRIEQLITEADTVLFVLSLASIASPVCQDEVDFAEKLRKRFVPIVAEDIAGHKVPDALARLNYVFFIANPTAGASGDFDLAIDDLVQALETDISWIREHTRIGALAHRWQGHGQHGGRDLLLRGAELDAGERWIASRPTKAPDPSDAHRAFLGASRRAATRRQRWIAGISAVAAVVAASLAGLAWQQRQVAVGETDRAVAATKVAEAQTLVATVARDDAQKLASSWLADAASKLTADPLGGDEGTAMLLALEALPDRAANIERPLVGSAELQLDRALRFTREQAVLAGHAQRVGSADWRGDGSAIVTSSSDGIARVWSLGSAGWRETAQFKGWSGGVNSVSWRADGGAIVTAGADYRARVWVPEGAHWREEAQLDGQHFGTVTSASWRSDGQGIVTASNDGTARVWVPEGIKWHAVAILKGEAFGVNSAAWRPDGQALVITSGNSARVWQIDGTNWREQAALQGHGGSVHSASWRRDGRAIVTASTDGTARVWVYDGAGWTESARLQGNGEVVSAAWRSDGDAILTASTDGTARVWLPDRAGWREAIRLVGHRDRILSAAWRGDGAAVVTASADGTVRVWLPDGAGWRDEKPFNDGGDTTTAAWRPDGGAIVSARSDGTASGRRQSR